MDSISLKDAVAHIVDNRGKTCPTSDNGMPLIATNCVKSSSLYPTKEKIRFVDSETYRTWFRGHPEPGDVLFVNKGSPGEVCLVPDPVDFCIAQDMVSLRPDNAKIDPSYFFAALRDKRTKVAIENMHVGTMIPHFKKTDFDKLYLPLPPRRDQEFIGKLYLDLSKRITINEKLNETLEDIAKAIFKSWFVDFDPVRAKAEGRPTGLPAEISDLFPDAFEESEIGEIPAGWELKELSHALSLDSGFAYKGNLKGEGSRYLMTMGCVSQTSRCEEKGIHKYGGDFKGKSLVNPGDICISSHDVTQAREHLGAPFIVPDTVQGVPTAAATNTFIVRATGTLPSEFIFQTMKTQRFRNEMIACAKGSVILHISKGAVTNYQYAHPCAELIDKFAFMMVPIVQRLDCASAENRILSELRDTLLPKLISGELRIPDAEKLLEEAGV